jgi:hypothetical protein
MIGFSAVRQMAFGAAIAAGVALSGAASAATVFDFRNGNLGANGNNVAIAATLDGIGVSVSAGTYAFDAIVDVGGRRVTKSNSGLGVDCSIAPGLCPNEIDGPLDLLTLIFDQKVNFISALFTEVDGDDDFDLFIDGVLVLPADRNIAAQNPFSLVGLSGTTISFGADAGTLTNLNEDDFRLGSLTVSAVPEPTTLALLAAALGALGLSYRRRTVAARASVR